MRTRTTTWKKRTRRDERKEAFLRTWTLTMVVQEGGFTSESRRVVTSGLYELVALLKARRLTVSAGKPSRTPLLEREIMNFLSALGVNFFGIGATAVWREEPKPTAWRRRSKTSWPEMEVQAKEERSESDSASATLEKSSLSG